MNTSQCWFPGLWPNRDLVVEKKNNLDTHQRARPQGQRGLGNSYIFGPLHSFVNFISSLIAFITFFHILTSCFLLNYNLTTRWSSKWTPRKPLVLTHDFIYHWRYNILDITYFSFVHFNPFGVHFFRSLRTHYIYHCHHSALEVGAGEWVRGLTWCF